MTRNFKESEVWGWPNYQPTMSLADRKMAIRLAQDAVSDETRKNAQLAANELQRLRDLANRQFPEYNGRLGIVVTSWLRPIEWEMYRNRSGKGQHPTGHAVDFIFIAPKLSAAKRNRIMEWAWDQYENKWPGGLARLVRGGNYSFIHVDHRGYPARWEY